MFLVTTAAVFGALALVLLWGRPAHACMTVLVGRRASENGVVLVGHNEDSRGRYVMLTHMTDPVIRTVPETVRFEPCCAELPLPEASAGLLWSEARRGGKGGGESYCDLFINRNGVVVCSDNCSDSREDAPDLMDGGIGYGLRRLVAEGARSAAHAVEIAADLIQRYGYADSGRSYHFADSEECWVVQVMKGKHFAVKRVPDDEVFIIPNHYTIHEPDPDTPGLQALVGYATKRGWYSPADGPFNFARACQAPASRGAIYNMHRHVRGLEILLERDLSGLLDRPEDLPFSVKPARPVGIGTLKKILRTHFEGTASDISEGGSHHFMSTRPICAVTTLESNIVEVRHAPERILARRALGRPCLSPYMPWYLGIAEVPEGYGYAAGAKEALATHFSVPATDLDWREDSAWFRTTAVQAAAELLGGAAEEAVRSRVCLMEDHMEDELRMMDAQIEMHMHSDPNVARAMMEGLVRAWGVTVREGMHALFSDLKVLVGTPDGELDASQAGARFSVRWDAQGLTPAALDPERCLAGPHYLPQEKWSVGSALEVAPDGASFKLTFGGGAWMEDADPCLTDLAVLLTARDGTRRAACVRLRVRRDIPLKG